MKVCNFFLLLTCLALTPSLISSKFLFYGSNGAAINFYGNEVCPRKEYMNFIDQKNGSDLTSNVLESQNFEVGSSAMTIDEILDIPSSNPFEQLQGELLWENGQAAVEGIEEIDGTMVEKVQEGFAPMIEETVEWAENFLVVLYIEDFLQCYEIFLEFNGAAGEESVEEVTKTPEVDASKKEEKEIEAVAEQYEMVLVSDENASTPAASLHEVERKKVIRMINSIIFVGFLGSLSLAYLSIASILSVFFKACFDDKDDAQRMQHFYKILTQLRKGRRPKAARKAPTTRKGPATRKAITRRRKALAARKALPAPKKPLALPAPPPKKDQDAQTEALPWPLDGECSSETNVSMGNISQSCA